jgi:prepilin-type N-terminal cleavage/methylation domain-containing protein
MNSYNSKKSDRPSPLAIRAFTLIELLTVIAIIGILAAIIIPTVGKVRQSAKSSVNLSNLRQVAMGLSLYANDNRQSYPIALDPTATPGSQKQYWFELIDSYMGANQANRREILISPNATTEVTGNYRTTYSVHAGIVPTSPRFGNYGPLKINNIPRPSQVILVADGRQDPANGGTAPVAFTQPRAAVIDKSTNPLSDVIPAQAEWDTDGSGNHLRFRNSGKLHAAMVDGSARAFTKDQLTYANLAADR